jgi:hypothetical protein
MPRKSRGEGAPGRRLLPVPWKCEGIRVEERHEAERSGAPEREQITEDQ